MCLPGLWKRALILRWAKKGFYVGLVHCLLSPSERAKHYREMSAAAFKLAAEAPTPIIKAGHMNLAANWHTLAASPELEMETPKRNRG